MKKFLPLAAILSALLVSACDNRPVVVTPPAEPVAIPGPAGPPGATGSQGMTGNQGNDGMQGVDGNKGKDGKPGDGTTVIVVPPAVPASSSAN